MYEIERADEHFPKRPAHENGNLVSHAASFNPQQVPKFDADVRIRPVGPEIYASFLKKAAKDNATSQPFSPSAGTTFRDMGEQKIDEPVSVVLLNNALATG